MASLAKLVPCLWFDTQAEAAARFYVDVFAGSPGRNARESRVEQITRYPAVGKEVHGKEPGSVLTVEFTLAGQRFTALNGGPNFTFSEAISLQIVCDDQAEVDYFWDKLRAGGDPAAQVCGWLKDRNGLSWQVFTGRVNELLADTESPAGQRAFAAMMAMSKIDEAAIEAAYAGR